MPEEKPPRVRTVRRDDDYELVRVSLRRVFQNLILLRAFVGVRFVGNNDVAVEGVLLVGVGCQGVDGDHTVADVSGDRSFHVVVDDPKTRFRLVLHGHAEARAVIFQEIEAFERLLERAADLVHL